MINFILFSIIGIILLSLFFYAIAIILALISWILDLIIPDDPDEDDGFREEDYIRIGDIYFKRSSGLFPEEVKK